MEYVIGILVAFVGGALLFFRKNRLKEIVKYEKEDARLEEKQRNIDSKIDKLNERIEKVKEAAKKLSEEEIEDFWNKDEDSK